MSCSLSILYCQVPITHYFGLYTKHELFMSSLFTYKKFFIKKVDVLFILDGELLILQLLSFPST